MTETQSIPTTTQKHPSKVLRLLATIVSYICHPVFMPTVMAIVVYNLAPVSFKVISPDIFYKKWLLIIAFITIFFPLVTLLLMKGLGFVESIHLRTSKDRIIPLIATMIYYFWISHVFANIPGVPVILRVLLLGNFWGIILLFIANIFVKVSMHTCAAGAMVGILIVLMIISPVNMIMPLFIALVIAGFIGSARLMLGAHTRGDIWLGYIIGVIVQLGAYVYIQYL